MRAIKIPASPAGRKIRNSIVLFFSLFLTLAVFSQVSAKPTSLVGLGSGKNLQPTTHNPQPNEWLYYKSSNDLSAYLGKKSSNLPTVRYQKGGDYLEFSMTGVSPNDIGSRLENASVSLETNVKQPNTPTLFYRNILNGTDVNYQITNIPFKIKEEIVLKQFPISNFQFPINDQISNSKIDNSSLNFLFSAETTGKPVKQKDGSIAFFGENGEYLFQLDKPFMIDGKGTRSEEVGIEIVSTNKKPIVSNGFFDALAGASAGIVNRASSLADRNVLSSYGVDNQKVLEARGIEPPRRGLTIPTLRQAAPRTGLFYHKENIKRLPMSFDGARAYQIILKADAGWLSTATYPVIIDPTVTHSTDAQFNGQKNRVSDSNSSTDAVQLESSYPEATKDPHTVLLLHLNEANGTTAGIRDYASTTRVITANGNASTTSSVTQLGLGNSAAFDGTGDYVSIPGNNDFYFTNTGSLSIDFWVKLNATNRHHGLIGGTTWSGSADTDWMIDWLDSNQLRFQKYSSGPTASIPQDTNWHHIAVTGIGGSFTLYFDGISVATSNISSSWGSQSTNLLIGTGGAHFNNVDSLYLNGNLDSLRILKGRALTPEEIKAAASRRPYAVYTSPVVDATASMSWNTVNWTEGGVNTGNGEQPYNTNSLVAQWDFNDTSGTTLTASSSGSCTTACNGTLTNFAYTASQDQATTTTGWTANNKKWGAGALMMESAASADYVSIADPASNALDPGTGDFSVEGWIKSSAGGQDTILQNNTTVGACATNAGYILIVNGNRNLASYASDGATCYVNNLTANASSTEIADGRWHHFAFVADRDTKAYVYYDGRLATSTTINNTTAANPAATIYFGASGATGDSDFILDSARYYSRALSAAEVLSNYQAGNIEIQTRSGATSDPNDGTWEAWKPTTGETQLLSMDSDKGNWNAPEQIDGYTKLLLHMDGADAATTFPNSATTTHTVTAVNQAQVDTAQSKFSGGSGLFDGTGDYLSVPDSDDWNFGSGNFTIETWINFSTLTNAHFFNQHADGSNYWKIYFNNDTKQLNFGALTAGSSVIDVNAPWSPAVNTWYHIALVRSGSTESVSDWNLFVNGKALTLTKASGLWANSWGDYAGGINIGRWGGTGYEFNGWLDELRISKGIARWTSNFTPPPRPYGSNVKAENETTIKAEGTGSAKLTLGAPQIDGNTVALWHFEETGTTTGTYLYDETANNNDATTTGTTVVDGIFGKARSFNGTSDYVSVADSSNFDIGLSNEPFTIEAFVKTTDTDGNIISRGGGVSAWNSTNGQQYHLTSYGTSARLYWWTGATWADVVSNEAITTGRWTHIVVTYNGTITRIFINGVAQTDTETAVYAKPSSSNLTKIGLIVSNEAPINGNIDELRIIKGRALSADEIAETYRLGANHHLTRQVSAVDLSAQTKLAFNVAADRPGTYLETMLGESDYANYELASSTLALSTTTVLYIKGDEIASSTSIKDSSFSGKAITANGDTKTSGVGKIGNSVYFDGTGDYLTAPANSDWGFGSGDFAIDMWVYPTSNPNAITGVMGLGASGSDSLIYTKHSASSGNMQASMRDTGGVTYIYTTRPISLNVWQHIALVRNGNNLNFYLNSNLIGSADVTGKTMVANSNALAIGIDEAVGVWPFFGYMDEIRIIKGTALTPDQIRQAYEYGLRTHPITIDFGATLQSSDLISSATDYNFSLTATTSGLSATTSGLYLGDKIIIKENLGGTEYTAQGTVNAINTATGAITIPSWDTGSTFPSGNGYSPNATVFKWQREYFDLTGAATTTRNAITNLTLRPTNGAEGRTIYLDDFRYNTNYLTASSSSAITSGNNRYLQYRAIFSSADTFVSPFLTAFNTLYTALANSFPSLIGVSGGGFLSF